MPQETQQKTFKLVKSPAGEINFKAPLEEFTPTDNRQTSLSENSGTHTQHFSG